MVLVNGRYDMDILKARYHAQAVVEDAVAAYWDTKSQDFHKKEMVLAFHKLAEAMGFAVIPLHKADEDATLDA
jgi:hypothetical protein